MPVSHRVDGIPEALSIYINQLVYDLRRRNRDITALSLGEAFFDIPSFGFDNADMVRGYHYSDSQGLPELRKRITDMYQDVYGATVNPDDEIMITAGSKVAIFMALQSILNPGDEVLIHEPAWLSYQEQIRLVDGEVRFVRYDHPIEKFGELFTDKTRCLVINNPNNPSGRVYTEEELQSLLDLCVTHNAYLLIDEAYSDFVEGDGFVTVARLTDTKRGMILCNSLSKNMGMSGWRIGYVIAEPAFINRLTKLNQHLVTCAPTILQLYLARHFDKLLKVTLPQIKSLNDKRHRVETVMNRMGLECMPGSSTFYMFVKVKDCKIDAFELCLQLLLKHGIAVVPGQAYGDSTSGYIRVSIGVESDERIEEALRTLKDMMINPDLQPGQATQLLENLGLPVFTNRV